MKIAQWMKHPVISVKPKDSVLHAREMMETHRMNQLPVTVDGRLVGIITDRDVRDVFPSVIDAASRPGIRPRRSGADPATLPVEDVMTVNVLTLTAGVPLADAARVMRRERIGAIPVVDGTRLVGIVTRSDVLDAFVELTGEALPAG